MLEVVEMQEHMHSATEKEEDEEEKDDE